MSLRNKRKWWEDGELAVLDKCNGTRPIVEIRGLFGEGEGVKYAIYQVVEVRSRECYPAGDRHLHRPTPDDLKYARGHGWQL